MMRSQNIILSLLLVVVALFGVQRAESQQISVSYLEIGEHLDRQSVFNVLKDDEGFVWFSTRSLVTRFDGRNMAYYRLNESEIITDADGLQTSLRYINGKLWAFTDNGKVYCYNRVIDKFEMVFNLMDIDSSLRLNDIEFDNKGRLILAATNGLHIANDDRFESFLLGQSFNSIILVEGVIAASTTRGIIFVEERNGKFVEQRRFLENHSIQSCNYDKKNNLLWCGTFDYGLKCINLRNGEIVREGYLKKVPGSPIRAIRQFSETELLIGLDGAGVYLVDTQHKRTSLFLSEIESWGGKLKGNGVYDILVDGTRVWVATYTGGLTVVNRQSDFQIVSHTPYNTQSLPNNEVNAILEDRDGDLWYATDVGISLYRVKERSWHHYIEDGKTYLTLSEDREGKIWGGGFNAGICCIEKGRGVLKQIHSVEGDNKIDCIYASFVDSRGDIWFGGLYNPLTSISKPFTGEERVKHYDITSVNSIVPIREDSLLVSTSNGIYIVDRTTGFFKHHFNSPSQMGLQTSSFIYSGVVVGENLWLGTSGGGLNRYSLKDNSAKNFSTYDDLPSNFIFAILVDNRENLWVSTNNGIFCFDPREEKMLFTVPDLPITNFLFTSSTKLRDGRLVYGSPQGALFMYPDYTPKPKGRGRIFLNNFRVFYEVVTAETHPEILSERFDDSKGIRLKHNQNSFSFDFGAVDLYGADDYLFTYQLVGFDEKWAPEDNYHGVEYTNIPSGEYEFVVKCASKINPSDVIERSMQVVILPPFWNTIWAYAIYLLVGLGLIYWVIMHLKKREENRQFDEKINLFVNVAHDIRTPLSLIMAPLKDLHKEEGLTKDGRYFLDVATQNSQKLHALVTRLLDFHRMEIVADAKEYSPVNLNTYVEQKVEGFRAMAREKEIELSLELPQTELFAKIDFDRLNHILDNLISNAIKYTPQGGDVKIRLVMSGKKVVFEVEDNGIGINREDSKRVLKDFYRAQGAIETGETGSGIGLAIARRLARQLKGDLTFTSAEGEGSLFRFSLPYRRVSEEDMVTNSVTEEEADEGEMERSSGRNRILIVEDNDDMRSYLNYTLSSEYRTYMARSAAEALEFLRTNVVDIVISDVMMEGMSGIELCETLKTNFETSHLFVILLTASTRQENIISGFESGADDYITKPFSIDLLRMKLNNLLQTRQKIQQHYLSTTYILEKEKEDREELEIKVSSQDDDFLKRAIEIVTENMANTEFNINQLCRELAMSRTLVYEKLRAMTGQSPSEFIRTIRLSYAKELLLSGDYSVMDVAALAGFSDAKYFSTVFKRYFGESPSKIIPD